MSVTTLPAVFSAGMVLSKTAKIWGWTSKHHVINAHFMGENYSASADENGRFEFLLNAQKFGGPFTLTVDDIIIEDVYVGRVWICGGQSNMEGPISRTRRSLGEFIKDDPRIRVFQAQKGLKFDGPAKTVSGKWETATGDFLNNMFAVPYFFARNIAGFMSQQAAQLSEDGIPIGLVCAAAGGTPLEGWLPEEIIRDNTELYEQLIRVKAPGFIETSTEKSEKAVREWFEKLDAADLGITKSWHSPDYDDSLWEEKKLLDPTDMPAYGVVWFRKRFKMPEVAGTATLKFGRFENNVEVFINGKKLIKIEYMYPPCVCEIPDGILREGENLISMRIVGSTHKPYVVPDKEYSILYPGGRVDFLQDNWKRETGAESEVCPPGVWFYERPCGVYNFMLAPLLGYSADGMLWYQGESNTARPHSYKMMFTAFIKHIRKFYGADFPIIYTQIANYIDPYSNYKGGFGLPGGYWAILREQQRQCLKIPNTAMAVTIDCGEWNDLHPTDKKTVGDRLALHARRMVYNEEIVSDGPTVENVEYADGDETLIVHFKHSEGLWAKGGHPIIVLIDRDGSVHSVYGAVREGKLIAPVGSLIPVVVRFGWADCPSVPVYNAHGLPASPFEEIIKRPLA
ncbi:MAG: beta galactosidase jelly roll domain-containing protein [Defluviitaleaceae bacterium]|nr:beta galactosidase jelly roll domain-containing protein [Defluviitaleaceae bacterium]